MRILTPAKINLFLKITGRIKKTGYHTLEMVMAPISFYDEMVVEEAEKFEIKMINFNESVPTKNNIIFKVFEHLSEFIGKKLSPFHITIVKNIPAGAGLGGGSSNAASFLLYLNKFLSLNLSMKELTRIALKTGSDVPFFLHKSPAIVKGLGEMVEPIQISEFYKHLIVLFPGNSVNTKYAYEIFDKKMLTNNPKININIDRVKGICSLMDWMSFIYNDFEPIVFQAHPEIKQALEKLEHFGSEKAFMTGSGSAVVGLYSDEQKCEHAVTMLSKEYSVVKKVELLI